MGLVQQVYDNQIGKVCWFYNKKSNEEPVASILQSYKPCILNKSKRVFIDALTESTWDCCIPFKIKDYNNMCMAFLLCVGFLLNKSDLDTFLKALHKNA